MDWRLFGMSEKKKANKSKKRIIGESWQPPPPPKPKRKPIESNEAKISWQVRLLRQNQGRTRLSDYSIVQGGKSFSIRLTGEDHAGIIGGGNDRTDSVEITVAKRTGS